MKDTNNLSINYIELVVTTKCSLKCKDCANLMQYYKKPYDVDYEIIEKSINKLINSVDEIKKFRILGGEPFLHSRLEDVINLVANSEKIVSIEVVTNGTIYPKKQSTINALKNEKVNVVVSNYGKLSKEKDNIMDLKSTYGINVSLLEIDHWLDYSNISCRNNDDSYLNIQYKKCNHQCTSLLNGKLFDCPRSAHSMDLGIIPYNEDEFVNLIDDDNIDLTRSKLVEMFEGNKQFIKACNYCDVGSNPKKIAPVLQINSYIPLDNF